MKSLYCLVFFVLTGMVYSQEVINQFDSNGKRHGLWKGYYEDSKRLRYEGTFEHGVEIGIFKFYDNTKAASIIATRDFTKGNGNCYTIFFDQKGNKVSEGNVLQKMFEGEWKYYHKESKIIMTVEFYKKGKLNGIRKVFYKEGGLAEEQNYVEGKKEGIYKKFGVNEKILEESNYKNNELHGEFKSYDGMGNLIVSGKYKNGKRVGIWKTYENGKVIEEEDTSKPNRKTFKYKTNEKGEKIPDALKLKKKNE